MLKWLNKRRKEPTSYIGLAAVIMGLGDLFKVDTAPIMADTVQQVAEPMMAGDTATAASIVLGGLLGVVLKEKGEGK